MADLATLQTRLLEAELAKHKLLTGTQEVEVDFNGIRTKYANSVTQLQLLDSYIADLKTQITGLGGQVTGESRRAIIVNMPGNC